MVASAKSALSGMSRKRKSALVAIGSLDADASPKRSKSKQVQGLLGDPSVVLRVTTSAMHKPPEELPFDMNALFLGRTSGGRGVQESTAMAGPSRPIPPPAAPAPVEPPSGDEASVAGSEVCVAIHSRSRLRLTFPKEDGLFEQAFSAVFPEGLPGVQDESGADVDSGVAPGPQTDRHFLEFLPELYAQEVPPEEDDLSCGGCGLTPTHQGHKRYRCRDCFQPGLRCAGCIQRSHRENPFHRLQCWNGSHFARSSLMEAGLVLEVGHHGASCRLKSDAAQPLLLTVVDWNGIHKCKVLYCNCLSSPSRARQLLQAGLLPASKEKPMTAFTFTVLRHFQTSHLVSKTAAYDYHKALVVQSDAAVPDLVNVRRSSTSNREPANTTVRTLAVGLHELFEGCSFLATFQATSTSRKDGC